MTVHDPLLTLKQAAEQLAIHWKTVRLLVLSGDLRASHAGTGGKRATWRIRTSEIARFLDAREVKPVGARGETRDGFEEVYDPTFH